MKYCYIILLLLFISNGVFAQEADTLIKITDSIPAVSQKIVETPIEKLLNENSYLNSKGVPVSLVAKIKKVHQSDKLFYLIVGLIFFFGVLKTVYSRYFSNLFRVFFNSSLRQSQLTDQLLQSKLPSLFFNILFLISGGFYVYFLIDFIKSKNRTPDLVVIGICITALLAIYLTKFLTVKFVGWVTGYKQEADTYIFVVFLINKIIGICLLPVIVTLAFSQDSIVQIVVIISLIFTGVMLLLRFFRSYGLLQHKLKVGRFHFLLYIFSLEILPIIVIYKATEFFVIKNL